MMESLQESASSAVVSNSKIIYRDQESINSFCLNSVRARTIRRTLYPCSLSQQMNPTLMAAGLSREIIELDVSSITLPSESFEQSDDENELSPSLLPQASA